MKLPAPTSYSNNFQFCFDNQFLTIAVSTLSIEKFDIDRKVQQLKNEYCVEWISNNHRQFLKFFIPRKGQRQHIYHILSVLTDEVLSFTDKQGVKHETL